MTTLFYAMAVPALFIVLVVLYLATRLVSAAWHRSKFEAEVEAAKRKLENNDG